MFTAAPDGSDLRVVDTNGVTAHFIWHDPQHILAWSKQPGPGFYVFEDRPGGKIEIVGPGMPTGDGHCRSRGRVPRRTRTFLPSRDQRHLSYPQLLKRPAVGRLRRPSLVACPTDWRRQGALLTPRHLG